jgi:hypothetical protein
LHQVRDHVRVIMVIGFGSRVPPVAAHIESNHIEVSQEAPPEFEVAVDSEAVAMADEDPRSSRIAVPPHP